MIADIIEDRINATYAEMQRQMNISLYGDREPAPRLKWHQHISRYLRVRRDRVYDAWLVLTGKADIGQ